MEILFFHVQILHAVEATADTAPEHMLASLAEESKKLLKIDSTIFMPILSQWNPRASVVSACLLHKLYGNKLVSFIGWKLGFKIISFFGSQYLDCVYLVGSD